MKKSIILISCFVATISLAQPATEVYLFDLSIRNTKIELSNPINVSNHEGYDNQPNFMHDGCLLYVSSINGQTDVFHYEDGQSTQITATPGGEYSPTQAPDLMHFTTILLEPDGTQLLWQYQLNGEDPKVLIPDLKIGYHSWVSENQIVSFVLGDPSTLQLSDLSTGENSILAENIGRSLHKIPGTDLFSYIQNNENEPNEIRAFNLQNKTSDVLINALEGSQDVTWAPDGTLFMGQGSKLYSWKKGQTDWNLVADLSEYDLKGISRLAVSQDSEKIAIVVSEE